MTNSLDACRENVIETYLGLAMASGGVFIRREPWATISTSEEQHSLHNFSLGMNLPAHPVSEIAALEELVHLCVRRPSMRVFAMTGDRPAGFSSILSDRGFRAHPELVMLARDARASSVEFPLRTAQLPRDRQRIAEFMVSQFFFGQPAASRRRVMESTARSKFDLAYIGDHRRISAAVMLSRTPTSLGLYNLCVAPSQRNQGLGSQVVEAAMAVADDLQVPLVLQCAHDLAGWYRARKFYDSGNLQAYSLHFGNALL